MDGTLHHFSASGLFDGLVLLIDDETETYWDHITGEAVHGPLRGKRLEFWNISITTVAAALSADPEVSLSRSIQPTWRGRLFGFFNRHKIDSSGFMPPHFFRTMGAPDKRLPRMSQGLGVVVDEEARFYPLEILDAGTVTDDWNGRTLEVARGEDRVPFAEWEDGARPFQLFTRWYGFSYTFPGCAIVERSVP